MKCWLRLPGTADVVFRATNYAGSTDAALSFTVYPIGTDLRPPTPVSGIAVNVIDYNRASVTWAPATDNAGVESYRITAYYTYQSRGTHSVRYVFNAPGDATTFEMAGLPSRTLKLYIQAIDAAGNVSPVGDVVSFTPVANPDFPAIKLAAPLPTVVADQSVQIQLTDGNPTPRTYSFVTAPAGATLDPLSGLISWTPGYADVGQATFTVRATNQFGYRDLTFTFPVYFTGAVQSAAYVRTGASTATAYWTPPVDASRIAGYYVKQTWSINGHTYTRTYKVDSPTAASLEGIYLVSGPVVHKVTVTAFDKFGNVGVSYPLVSLQ